MESPRSRGTEGRKKLGNTIGKSEVTKLDESLQRSHLINLARERYRIQSRDALVIALESKDDDLARVAHGSIIALCEIRGGAT